MVASARTDGESVRAIRSGRTRAIRRGTSSARISDAAVIASTIIPIASGCPIKGERPDVFDRVDKSRGDRQSGIYARQTAQKRRPSVNGPEQVLESSLSPNAAAAPR